MTEIKQEPLDHDDQDAYHDEVREILEVKDPLDIKLEPVVVEQESSDLEDEELEVDDDDDSKSEELVPDKDDSDFVLNDSNEESEDIDVDIEVDEEFEKNENSSKEEEEDSNGADEEDDKKKLKSIEIMGMTILQKGQYSKCPKCKKFIKSTFIIRHIKLHDKAVEKVTCPEKSCDMTFARINNLFRHLKSIHKSKEPFMCKYANCQKRFSKSKSLTSHLAQHRAEKRREKEEKQAELDDLEQEAVYGRFICEFPGCEKSYGKKHHLKEHERKHTGDMKYTCDVCGKKFYIQAHMKRHMYSHTGLKPHVCRWKCGLTFASYGGRMKHERINHYEENPLEIDCDVCGRPFRNQQLLVKHRMTHLNPSERMEYRCSFCHIMFDTVKIRLRHEKLHKDGDNFACPECDRQFTNEKNLAHHIKHHHTATEASDKKPKKRKDSPAKSTKPAPKTHPCHLCTPTKLFCLTSLRRHLARIHSTNFKCDECGKGFKEKDRFENHLEIHRLRKCHLCGKIFKRKQNADIHLIGMHKLTPSDLAKLGRWNPRRDTEECPDYMTRASHKSRSEIERMEATDEIDIKEEPLDEDEIK